MEVSSVFRIEWHRDVLKVLEALDAERLLSCGALFGGGTRLALDLNEYRESLDVDFLCSDASGYADLRMLARQNGYAALFPEAGSAGLSFPREMKIDQYGIRFVVLYGERMIKVEIIREARVDLAPGVRPGWAPVDCLAVEDCWAIKLLANSDRWPDRQVLSRDLFDLAAMRANWGSIPEGSWQKAEEAYKSSVRTDLGKALDLLLNNEDYRRRCFTGLKISEEGVLLKALQQLLGETQSVE